MRYKQRRLLKFAFIIAIIVFSYFLFAYYQINLGLDLQGGSHIVLQAQPSPERAITPEVMRGITSVI